MPETKFKMFTGKTSVGLSGEISIWLSLHKKAKILHSNMMVERSSDNSPWSCIFLAIFYTEGK